MIMSQVPSEVKRVLEAILEYKENAYSRFLAIKLDFKELNHRMIVQNIFNRYIPQQKVVLNGAHLCLGFEEENLRHIGISLKNLQNLQCLEIYLQENGLSMNDKNLMHLGNGFQFLTKLKYLKLNLQGNHLGQQEMNQKHLGERFRYLYKLQFLHLELQNNYFGLNENNMRYIGDGLKCLPKSLKILWLDLLDNNLGENQNNLRYLTQGLKELKNLESLKLNLAWNGIGQNEGNLKCLVESIQELSNLRSLELYLQNNNLGDNTNQGEKEYLKYIGLRLQSLYNLKKLKLFISFFQNADTEYIEQLRQSLKKMLPNLEVLEVKEGLV